MLDERNGGEQPPDLRTLAGALNYLIANRGQ